MRQVHCKAVCLIAPVRIAVHDTVVVFIALKRSPPHAPTPFTPSIKDYACGEQKSAFECYLTTQEQNSLINRKRSLNPTLAEIEALLPWNCKCGVKLRLLFNCSRCHFLSLVLNPHPESFIHYRFVDSSKGPSSYSSVRLISSQISMTQDNTQLSNINNLVYCKI
jgi:hypothetical protein